MDIPYIVKYQPRNLNDFQASTDLKDYINACIETHDLNLLLIGDPGTGKTSLLNIIIKLYFGDVISDKHIYETHILFINSLKEQGISFYRNDVKTFCQTRSILPNRKKIVILDDIDFINEQSQQVFRSCMDKYGSNVNFLISCINTQKVIESLQSRTTLIKLPLLVNHQLEQISSNIIKSENIDITDEAFKYLIKISNFSVRLITNYLEKMKILNKPITLELVHEICSNINYKFFEDFIMHCSDNSIVNASDILYSLSDKGFSVMDILDSLTQYIKRTEIIDEVSKYSLMPIICKYISIFHEIHEDDIELILLTRDIIKILHTKD
jgi:DNA polymerase III delta prime subunit